MTKAELIAWLNSPELSLEDDDVVIFAKPIGSYYDFFEPQEVEGGFIIIYPMIPEEKKNG